MNKTVYIVLSEAFDGTWYMKPRVFQTKQSAMEFYASCRLFHGDHNLLGDENHLNLELNLKFIEAPFF